MSSAFRKKTKTRTVLFTLRFRDSGRIFAYREAVFTEQPGRRISVRNPLFVASVLETADKIVNDAIRVDIALLRPGAKAKMRMMKRCPICFRAKRKKK